MRDVTYGGSVDERERIERIARNVAAGFRSTRHREIRPVAQCRWCGFDTAMIETTYATRLHPGECTERWDAAYDEAGITRGPWRPMSLIARERL